MKRSLVLVAALAVLLGCIALSQTPAGPKHHVVFQLSEENGPAWGALVLHVNNTMQSLAQDGGSEVEVVFYGPGLLMLKNSNTAFEERLEQLSKKGVKLLACRNAMKSRNVKTEDMFPSSARWIPGLPRWSANRKPAGLTFIDRLTSRTCRQAS